MHTSKKRAFITGAGGFIEANLVYYFLKKNYELHILLKKTQIIGSVIIKKLKTY